jgi:hypothetical protein
MTSPSAIPRDDPSRRLTVADSGGGFARYLSAAIKVIALAVKSVPVLIFFASR